MREGLSVRLAAALALAAFVVVWPVTRIWYAHVGLPPTPSWVVVLLFVAATVLTVLLGRTVRVRRQQPSEPMPAVGRSIGASESGAGFRPGTPGSWRFAVRVLAWAQASAMAGALCAGAGLGCLVALAADLDAWSVRSVAMKAAGLVVASAALACGGLWAQRACRTPSEPPRRR